MKISEVEVGVEYGVVEYSDVRYTNSTPRHCKVVGIVTEEQKTFGAWTDTAKTRKVRKVKVKVLDSPLGAYSSWRTSIRSAKKNSTAIVDAKQLVGLWKDLRGDILARAKENQAKIELEKTVTKRVRALKLRNADVYCRGSKRVELRVEDNELYKLLALAEMGAGISAS